MVSCRWILVIFQILVTASVIFSGPAIKNKDTIDSGANVNNTVVEHNDNSEYKLEHFHEVHDQRQKGIDNYKVNIDGVAFVWAPLGSLITAATMFNPDFLESEYADLEELFNPQSPEKPVDTITSPKPGLISGGGATKNVENSIEIARVKSDDGLPITKISDAQKRKFRIPVFLRPFLRNRRVLVQTRE